MIDRHVEFLYTCLVISDRDPPFLSCFCREERRSVAHSTFFRLWRWRRRGPRFSHHKHPSTHNNNNNNQRGRRKRHPRRGPHWTLCQCDAESAGARRKKCILRNQKKTKERSTSKSPTQKTKRNRGPASRAELTEHHTGHLSLWRARHGQKRGCSATMGACRRRRPLCRNQTHSRDVNRSHGASGRSVAPWDHRRSRPRHDACRRPPLDLLWLAPQGTFFLGPCPRALSLSGAIIARENV